MHSAKCRFPVFYVMAVSVYRAALYPVCAEMANFCRLFVIIGCHIAALLVN